MLLRRLQQSHADRVAPHFQSHFLSEGPVFAEAISRTKEAVAALGENKRRAEWERRCDEATLGNAYAEPAPLSAAVAAQFAAQNKQEQIYELMEWMKSAIPEDREVTHSYLAVRLLLAYHPEARPDLAEVLRTAFYRVEGKSEFKGWYTSRPREGQKSGNTMYYHRPTPTYDL